MQLQRDDSVEIFKQFIDKVNQQNVQQLLQKAEIIFAVRQFKLNQLSPSMALQIYQNISIKFARNLFLESELNWWENQLRIFVWALVLYVHLNSTKIQTLTTEDWSFFSSIFPHKQLILFQYQSINILREHNQAKKWVQQEDQLFIKLVNEKGLKCKWSELAKLLYIDSNKVYFRTPKQCRQRWLNHLDPSKSKCEWSTREDFVLIRYVHGKQKRWAEISKMLDNKRNEHSIKNRFKSLITKQLKFHKQKLSEKQLIESIYNRYKTYLSKGNNNRIVGDKQGIRSEQKQKMQEMNEGQYKSAHLQKLQNHSNRLNRLTLERHHSQTPMYPFTWYSKQQSFVPFRKSQEYFPFSSYQNQQPNIKRNFITTFSNNLDEFNIKDKMYGHIENAQMHQNKSMNKQKVFNSVIDKQQIDNKKVIKTENNFFNFKNHTFPSLNKKQHKNFPIPNEYYEPENHFYSDLVLNSAFGSSSQIQLGSNYEQFLPVQQNQSIDNHMLNQNDMHYNNFMQKKGHVKEEMDEEERKIRAQIFMVDNPIDVVRQYFYGEKNVKNANNLNVSIRVNESKTQE